MSATQLLAPIEQTDTAMLEVFGERLSFLCCWQGLRERKEAGELQVFQKLLAH